MVAVVCEVVISKVYIRYPKVLVPLLELGATAKRRNVDPLDTSKYILAARSALEGGIFNL